MSYTLIWREIWLREELGADCGPLTFLPVAWVFWNADAVIAPTSSKSLRDDVISCTSLFSCQIPQQLFSWNLDSFLLLALLDAKSQRVTNRNSLSLCGVMTWQPFKAGHKCHLLSHRRAWGLELGNQGGGTEKGGDTDTCHWELPVNDVHLDTNENSIGSSNLS